MEGDEAVKVDYYDGIRISYPKDCGNAPKKLPSWHLLLSKKVNP